MVIGHEHFVLLLVGTRQRSAVPVRSPCTDTSAFPLAHIAKGDTMLALGGTKAGVAGLSDAGPLLPVAGGLSAGTPKAVKVVVRLGAVVGAECSSAGRVERRKGVVLVTADARVFCVRGGTSKEVVELMAGRGRDGSKKIVWMGEGMCQGT